MLRVLLIILSIVSVILAVALGQPLFYVVALGLLAGSATLTTVKMKKRHDDVPESFMKAPDEPVEDLNSFGILEVRPKTASESASTVASSKVGLAPSEEGEVQQVLDFSPEERMEAPERIKVRAVPIVAAAHENDSPDILGEVRTRKPRARIMVSEVVPEQDAEVVIPALRSLRAGLDAYTVCLLRQERTQLRYHVEAMVSQNSYARGQGVFTTSEPLLAGQQPLVPVVFPGVGADGISKNKLGYYHEPIAVRQVSMVLVHRDEAGDSYFLVVDTMNDRGLESESALNLLAQYATLILTLLESAARGDLIATKPEKGVKPRREIIADEMQKARKESQPLALALVFLNRGEEIVSSGETDINEMESVFAARLREVATSGRVEQFGELTFGVFYRGNAETVASWASHLQSAFVDADGHLRGGVSVGVALLNARHESPDDLRSDATAALQEAFETGECTIVE